LSAASSSKLSAEGERGISESEYKEIQASSTRNVSKPLKLLLEMNDVAGINCKKVFENDADREKIRLGQIPNDRWNEIHGNEQRSQIASHPPNDGKWRHKDRCSGFLNWGHVEPINRDDQQVAARLTVYAWEPEGYITFITPEAYNKLEQYKKLREEHGEKIT
jgi:hypothetical protein